MYTYIYIYIYYIHYYYYYYVPDYIYRYYYYYYPIIYIYIYIYIYNHREVYGWEWSYSDHANPMFQATWRATPGLHNKIPAHKIFARVWVAQKSFSSLVAANIFQGLGPKRQKSCYGDRVYLWIHAHASQGWLVVLLDWQIYTPICVYTMIVLLVMSGHLSVHECQCGRVFTVV